MRPGDEHVAAGHIARLARELRGAAVDGAGAIGKAERGETEPVGAERVGLDGVRAGLDVLAVHRADQVGVALDQLEQRGQLRHAAAPQQRAHGAVEEQRLARDPFGERAPSVR